MVSFDVSDADAALIVRAVDRALDIIAQHERMTKADRRERRVNLMMDLTACHANGNPLNLAKLAGADDFNLMHDVGGISRHIDRDTGKLTNCFRPRCSAPESVSA